MALPDYPPLELAQFIHDSPEGTRVGQFTLDTKTLIYSIDGRLLWSIVVSRGANVWTGQYTTRSDGTFGKVYGFTDQNGRLWIPDLVNGGWL